MAADIRPFRQDSLSDAVTATHLAYSGDCTAFLSKMLENPLLRQTNMSVGDIAYQDGKPVGFQAAIPRKLWLGNREVLGVVGSTLGMWSQASPVLLFNLMKATIAPRGGSELFFGNTANPKSMKMNRLLGVKGAGPCSCEMTRFAVIHVFSFLSVLFRDKVPLLRLPCIGRRCALKRLPSIERETFDCFWEKYKKGACGLVSSRTARELNWLFGDRVRNGQSVLLAKMDQGQMLGYIIISTSGGRRLRWRVSDMIALNNDKRVIRDLLTGAVRYLRRETNAATLETVGFCLGIQETISSVLRFKKKNSNNSFLFEITSEALRQQWHVDFVNDWFWGPYDGDMCL